MLKMEVVSKRYLGTFATDFATEKILLTIRNPVSIGLTGSYSRGSYRIRTYDPLLVRQVL
jgi:hypothetical protein